MFCDAGVIRFLHRPPPPVFVISTTRSIPGVWYGRLADVVTAQRTSSPNSWNIVEPSNGSATTERMLKTAPDRSTAASRNAWQLRSYNDHTTAGAASPDSARLTIHSTVQVVRPTGFEPVTLGSEDRCSIH